MITANSIDADVGIVIVFNIVVAVFDNSDDEIVSLKLRSNEFVSLFDARW